jgi:hypothetical protein
MSFDKRRFEEATLYIECTIGYIVIAL